MRRVAIISVFFVLLGLGSAVKLYDTVPAINREVLPKNILSEIAARIASNGPLDDVGKLFDNLESQIRKEQVEHDELYSKQSSECKAEISFRKKEIADSESALGSAGRETNACKTSLQQNTAQLETNVKGQEDLETNLKVWEQRRQSEKSQYDIQVGHFNAEIASLQEGLRILEDLTTGSASLLELSKVTQSMFKNSIYRQSTAKYAGVMGALAQVAQKSDMLIDPTVIDRVKELFKQLEQEINESIQALEEMEAKAIAEYEKTREKLNQQDSQLKRSEKILRENIANYEQCIVKSENIIAQATTKKERNNHLFSDASKMCKTFDDEYNIANGQRKEELGLIDRLRTLCKEKAKTIGQK